jgi:hypothetical protein
MTRDYNWAAAGAKTVTVTASNALGGVSGFFATDVQDLSLTAATVRRPSATNSLVDLTISGTSSQSVYRVEFKTNLFQATWQVAEPAGAAITGADGSTAWTDSGSTNRDLNASPCLFYRAVLDE